MQINVSGDSFDVTPPLKAYVNDKLKKLETRFHNITNVHVILSVDKKFQQKAEATVHLARGELFAHAISENMYASIDDLLDKLERQAVKHKEKLQHRRDEEL